MSLGNALNPGPNQVTENIGSAVFFDRTLGNLYASDVHLGKVQLSAAVTLTVTASPFSYTNLYNNTVVNTAISGTYTPQQLLQVFINGGTISALTITRQGTATAIPIATPMVLLSVNDVLTVTYSVAPTMTVFQMY